MSTADDAGGFAAEAARAWREPRTVSSSASISEVFAVNSAPERGACLLILRAAHPLAAALAATKAFKINQK